MDARSPSSLAGPEAQPAALPRLLRRDFVLLWSGQTVSQLGNQAHAIAMMFWLMKATGSASLMGMLMTSSMLPGVVLGPFGGTYADRHSRIRIVVVSNLLAGFTVAVLAAALWTRPGATRLLTGLLFAVAIGLGLIRAFFGPAIAAAIPDLVARERLAAANSLSQFSQQSAIFIGQAVGGVLYGAVGAAALFSLDALSFFVAGGSAALIPRDRPRPAEQAPGAQPFRRFVRETVEGFRFVWAQKGMRDFLVSVSLINFLGMPTTVLFPFYVEIYLHGGSTLYGLLMSALSLGVVAGFILAGSLRLTGRAQARGILTALILYPVCFSLLAVIRTPAAAIASLFAGGMTVGVMNVSLITLLQAATPKELRGRVMGLLGTLSGGLVPLGMALGGVIGDLTGKNVPLILLVSAALGLLVTFYAAARRECREFLAGTAA